MSNELVSRAEPPDWRHVPDPSEGYLGQLEPNYFCRHWNPGRGKYCRARAGQGTDHPGVGRCKHAGGATPVRHGLHSTTLRTRPRLLELRAELAAAADPWDTLDDLLWARTLFRDWLERSEAIFEALLVWHASYAPGLRPIAPDQAQALQDVLDELEALVGPIPEHPEPRTEQEPEPHGGSLLRTRYEEDADEGEQRIHNSVRQVRRLLVALRTDPGLKPRQMPDFADAHRILDTVTKIVERRDRREAANAIPRKELFTYMERLAYVVRTRVEQAFRKLRAQEVPTQIAVDGEVVEADEWLLDTIAEEWGRVPLA